MRGEVGIFAQIKKAVSSCYSLCCETIVFNENILQTYNLSNCLTKPKYKKKRPKFHFPLYVFEIVLQGKNLKKSKIF